MNGGEDIHGLAAMEFEERVQRIIMITVLVYVHMYMHMYSL